MVLQPDGKIVVAGLAYNGADDDFALVRYNVDGSLDTTFGTNGKVATGFGLGQDAAFAVALTPDGKIVTVGYAYNGADYDFAVARFDPGGSLDTMFDSDGKVTTDFGSGSDGAWAVAVLGDGRIVAAGEAYNGVDIDLAIARYNADGTLDAGFDSDGKAAHDFGSGDDAAIAMDILEDGRMLVAGYADNGADYDFAVARYDADGPELTATVTGLTNGTAYTFTVVSTNSVGASASSSQSNEVIAQGPPDPPTNVAASAGAGEATVSWSAPASDGGSPITQYTVTSDPGALTTNVDGTTLTATVTGLTNGTAYTFTVAAVNALGTSGPSGPSSSVTPAVPTPSPTPTPIPVPSLSTWSLVATALVFGLLLATYRRKSMRGRRVGRPVL